MQHTVDAQLEVHDVSGEPGPFAGDNDPGDAEAATLIQFDENPLDGAALDVDKDAGALAHEATVAPKIGGSLIGNAVEMPADDLESTESKAPGDVDGGDTDAQPVSKDSDRVSEAVRVDTPATDDLDADAGNPGDTNRPGDGNNGDGSGGDHGGEHDDNAGDDRGEAEVRRAYSRFAADIARKGQAAKVLGEPITVRVEDSADPSGVARYETRLSPAVDGPSRAQEEARYEALIRAKQIVDPAVRADLQQIEAYGGVEGQIVTRVLEGKRLSELTDDDKRLITETEIHAALATIEAMVRSGVVPNRDFGNSISINPQSNRLQFSDYETIEQTDADVEHPVLTAGDAFIRAMESFRDPATRGKPEGAAGERIRDLSQHVLRDHYMYLQPYIAYSTETLDEDAIKAVYANTAPSRSTTTHDLHVASQMHDMALASDADEQTRLNLLGNAREAYEISIYHSVLDRKGNITEVLRVDDQGRNMLLTNDHVLQARLALAFWPVSEARVLDEALPQAQRQEVNHNLAVVLGEMMPGGEAPEPSHDLQTSHRGFLSEVVAMTALSRVRPDVDTSLTIPTSEAQRLYAGPDAAVLFYDDGGYALDVDWKMRGGENDPDAVNVGYICYTEVSKESVQPSNDGTDSWRSVLHVARLLHDEQLGNQPLSPEETALLDRVQQAIWDTISDKSRDFLGIDNLRERARF